MINHKLELWEIIFGSKDFRLSKHYDFNLSRKNKKIQLDGVLKLKYNLTRLNSV